MATKRPPDRPGPGDREGSSSQARPRVAEIRDGDSTILAPRPDMTDDTGNIETGQASLDSADADLVFSSEEDLTTQTGGRKPQARMITSDVSLIEAQSEMASPAMSGDFEAPRITSFGDGAMIVDDSAYNPPTEVLRLAFSDP